MEVQQYLNAWKVLYNHLFDFIDDQEDSQNNYQNLISDIKYQNIAENKNEFRQFLQLIVLISNNHHRSPNFFNKIDQILSSLSPKIAQTFSNSEIFDIFNENKRVLLFLIKNDIFTFDENLKKKIKNQNYLSYFDESDENHAEVKKKKGENDSYLCQLIREDSIEEFIAYVNKTNCPLTSTIKSSIYETNYLLIYNKVTLIEYAVFFGAIQIVKYLMNKEIKLTESMLISAIHSNNPEIIQIFEDEKLVPKDYQIIQKCIKESIICHHNEIATYIHDNFLQKENNFFNNIHTYSFNFYDYSQLAKCEINNAFFLYACKYNYIELVKLLLNDANIDKSYTHVIFFFIL